MRQILLCFRNAVSLYLFSIIFMVTFGLFFQKAQSDRHQSRLQQREEIVQKISLWLSPMFKGVPEMSSLLGQQIVFVACVDEYAKFQPDTFLVSELELSKPLCPLRSPQAGWEYHWSSGQALSQGRLFHLLGSQSREFFSVQNSSY